MAACSFGLAFPGQGAKYEAIVTALRQYRGDPLIEQLLGLFGADDPADLDLGDTAVAQPATYATGIAAANAAPGTAGDIPLVLGHSLGELTAAAYAGMIDVESGFKLAVRRGALCRDQNTRRPGAMVAVIGTDLDDMEWLRRRAVARSSAILEIAGVNSRRQTVLSGDLIAIHEAVRLADEESLRAEILPIGGGFHSPLMLDVLPAWRAAVESVEFRVAGPIFVSTVDAKVHTEPAEIKELLVRALLLPVRWRDAVRTARDQGIAGLWDAGPGDTLLKLGRRDKVLQFAQLGPDPAGDPHPVAPGPARDPYLVVTGAAGDPEGAAAIADPRQAAVVR